MVSIEHAQYRIGSVPNMVSTRYGKYQIWSVPNMVSKQLSGEAEPDIKFITQGDEAEPNMTSPSAINLKLGEVKSR